MTGGGLHPRRFDRLDALRAVAIVWMAIYHFCYDLNHFGLLSPRQNFFSDPFWTVQRTAIVSLFLLCAGIGQAVAVEQGQSWPRFWRRWAQVAGCAVLVSIGSALMFHERWISFGVLHGIAVMLVLLRVGAPLGRWWLVIGVLAVVLPLVFRHPVFNGPLLSWVGLVTRKPATEDYVPLLPWLGAMAFGFVIGRELVRRRHGLLTGALPHALQPLAALGRWSLTFYMVHQPVLIGLVLAWVWLAK